MGNKIRFLPPSDIELEEAILYYDEQLEGLGTIFYNEVIKATDYIDNYPDGWQKIGTNTRKFILRRFPYSLKKKPPLLVVVQIGYTMLFLFLKKQSSIKNVAFSEC